MSQPFARIPEPEIPRPFKRRLQPNGVQQALHDAWKTVRRLGEDGWRRGRRHSRVLGMAGGAVGLLLVGGYTLKAWGIGRSACAAAAEAGAPKSKSGSGRSFLLLMDPVPATVSGSELEIHYDVCGLPSGATYRGRLELTPQRTVKKGSAKPKPLVVTFKDRTDGPETRRHREVELAKLKPGVYTVALSIADGRGRERKTVQRLKLTR